MDLISVVMPVYKEDLNILKQSVCSILKQSYPNVEFIIIVDNPLYKKAIKYLQEIKQMHKNVFVFVNNKNEGIVFSLNKGIKLAHGKYIARMDADDISVDSRLSKELLYLKEGNYDIVGSYYYNIDINSNILYIRRCCYDHRPNHPGHPASKRNLSKGTGRYLRGQHGCRFCLGTGPQRSPASYPE